MTKRRVWWTIILPGGKLDVEDHNPYQKLVLFDTRKDAEDDVATLTDGARVVKVRIEPES